jgi:hypothetical protein
MISSAILIFIPFIIVEVVLKEPNVFQEISHQMDMLWIIFIGVFITTAYQTAGIAVMTTIKAIAFGGLHQVLLLPQLLLYTLLNSGLHIIPRKWNLREFQFDSVFHWVGASFIILGCFLCTYIFFIIYYL